jgi:hypothetical protein
MENINEVIQPRGFVKRQVFDQYGNLFYEDSGPNTITTLGKAHIADRVGPRLQDPMINMAIGTGTPSTTALGTEISRRGFRSTSTSGAVWTFVSEWNYDDNVAGSITEAGVFNSEKASTGTMLCSALFTAIPKVANGTLVITWTITVT